MKQRVHPEVIILHTNDLHGRIEGLASIASIINDIRTSSDQSHVLFFDLGDSEETTVRLSNLTKGTAMHRLLSTMGCDAIVVGNAAILRYGPQVIREHAEHSSYPHLVANLCMHDGSQIPGTQSHAKLRVGERVLGLIGVTAENPAYERFYGMRALPLVPTIRAQIQSLREQGADAIILLSHMALDVDRELASAFQGELSMIIGGHSHDALKNGEQVGSIHIFQAGHYAEHLGRIDLRWKADGLEILEAKLLPVSASIEPAANVVQEIDLLEREVSLYLDEIVAELQQALDFASDKECGVVNLMADALRERMEADIGVVVAGQAFTGPLPAGLIPRMILWERCPSTANPGFVHMRGDQLKTMLLRGLDPEFAQNQAQGLRGSVRGLMHISGATVRDGKLWIGSQQVDPKRMYRVAGSDFEFEPVWGYVDENWNLEPIYDIPVILRETLESYMHSHTPLPAISKRIFGGLST